MDPQRVQVLVNMSPPKTVGDVWKFLTTAEWVREYLISEAASALGDFKTAVLKGKPRQNMCIAEKIKLVHTDWGEVHRQAWETIKKGLLSRRSPPHSETDGNNLSDTSTSGLGYGVCDYAMYDVR